MNKPRFQARTLFLIVMLLSWVFYTVMTNYGQES